MDERNQRRLDSQRAELSPKEWERKWSKEESPGPQWAWAISSFRLVGWIGDIVIVVAGWRHRRDQEAKDA